MTSTDYSNSKIKKKGYSNKLFSKICKVNQTSWANVKHQLYKHTRFCTFLYTKFYSWQAFGVKGQI